jgi:hypothetical protein
LSGRFNAIEANTTLPYFLWPSPLRLLKVTISLFILPLPLTFNMTKIIFTTLLAAFAIVAQAVKLTNSDWDVVAGETFIIGWTGAEGQVSIRLKSGPANGLQTVQEIAGSCGHDSERVT